MRFHFSTEEFLAKRAAGEVRFQSVVAGKLLVGFSLAIKKKTIREGMKMGGACVGVRNQESKRGEWGCIDQDRIHMKFSENKKGFERHASQTKSIFSHLGGLHSPASPQHPGPSTVWC